MSSFYNSRKSFDTSDRGFTRSPFYAGDAADQRTDMYRGSHSNASTASLTNGGAPMHAMMVPGVVVPSLDRPTPETPFSKWEAFIVKQTKEWSDKRAKTATSSPPTNSKPRIVWADQIRKPSPPAQPLAYTKASDRLAMSPPPLSPPANTSSPKPRGGLLRKASFDLLRSSPEARSSSPSPPSSQRPSISSPMMTTSILATAPMASAGPASQSMRPRVSIDASWSRPRPEPLDLSRTNQPYSSSVRSLSPLPLQLPGDDFSASLFDNFGKRSSTGSGSSGPDPFDPLATPLPMLPRSEIATPQPSVADTVSLRDRRGSWASSIDLDPAIIRTPPLSDEKWQAQRQLNRPGFLAEYGLDHDDNESDSDGSIYSNDDEAGSSLPSVSVCAPHTPQDHQELAGPIFQRLEADLLPFAEQNHDGNTTPRCAPDGRPLPQLEISSLPREREELIRKSRARLISPRTFRRAFSIKKQNTGSTATRSTDSSPNLSHSSSDEGDKISESTDAFVPPRMPGMCERDFVSTFTEGQSPSSPVTLPALTIPQPSPMHLSPSIDSLAGSFAGIANSSEGSEGTCMSPVFSITGSSITSMSSRDFSSLGSSSLKKHRVGTPGLTKTLSPLAGPGSAATIDPHFARVSTRARSNGSVSSHTPSVELTSPKTGAKRSSRKRGRSSRSRITDSMPSFADVGSTLAVPVGGMRRGSTRSLSSEGSFDTHSNASSGSSYGKVGGSSDDGTAPSSVSSVSSMPVKGVLRKRVPSADSPLLSSKKEVSFDLPASVGFAPVDETQEEELLEHEQKQRGHLKLPPMKLQASKTAVVDDAATTEHVQQSATLGQNDLDIHRFLSTFGADIKTVESLELLDNVHAGISDWPKREDWDSLPAYLLACATTFLSAYADDSATLVYSDERAPASDEKDKSVSAPLMSQNPLYTSVVRSIFRVASWEQPMVSLGVSAAYAYTWSQGKLTTLAFVGLALLAAVQASQQSTSSSEDAQQLSVAYSKIASVLMGSEQTRERMRNLMLARSPKASLRIAASLAALVLGAIRFGSGLIFSLPGLFVGLALFAWLPAILHQPEWAPTWLKQGNPVDALLYDVPTDAQHAILTLRRRAASGEQLVHRADFSQISLSPTSFDHRVSQQDLQHASDVLEGAFFAKHDNQSGHLIVLASRIIFRTLAGKPFTEGPVSLVDDFSRGSATKGCKITFDARLEKVVRLDKVEENGLEVRLKNGQRFRVEAVERRDEAFNRMLALAPQRWH